LTPDDLRAGWPGDVVAARLSLVTVTAILNSIRSGAFPATGAALAGISAARYRAWRRATGAAFEVFRTWLADAEAVSELAALRLVTLSNDWRIALMFLLRRWPGHWSQRGQRRAEVHAELVASLGQSADAARRSAALSAQAQRVRFWEHRQNVQAARARRAAERADPAP
jgi:hypothetical protein